MIDSQDYGDDAPPIFCDICKKMFAECTCEQVAPEDLVPVKDWPFEPPF